MGCKVRTLFCAGVSALAMTGCANFGPEVPPSPQAVKMKVTEAVTPTRLQVRHNLITYHIDLAYFYPSTVLCGETPSACKYLSTNIVGKEFWIEREYDRFGLQMHTLWRLDNARTSENIDLLLNAGYTRMVDHKALPNGKSELVAKAADLGFAKAIQKHRVSEMKPWEKRKLENLDGK